MSNEPILSEEILNKYSTQYLVDLATIVLKIVNERRRNERIERQPK